jgi:hypothetical protein
VEEVDMHARPAFGELVPPHVEVRVRGVPLAVLYKTVACHSYNVVPVPGSASTKSKKTKKQVRVASIDTLMALYLAFLYARQPYYSIDRLVCTATWLQKLQEKNRLEQKGLLQRFTVRCLGNQETRQEIRAEKATMYERLKNRKESREFDKWFLNYVPREQLPQKRQPRMTQRTRRPSFFAAAAAAASTSAPRRRFTRAFRRPPKKMTKSTRKTSSMNPYERPNRFDWSPIWKKES